LIRPAPLPSHKPASGDRDGMAGSQVLRRRMTEFLAYALIPIAVGTVAVILILGLANMMKGGSPQTSQKLMRLRVLAQFVALVIVMITIWLMAR
jgi:NADH:ubiquinone oxidoreductase subunit 6 (subunit J)